MCERGLVPPSRRKRPRAHAPRNYPRPRLRPHLRPRHRPRPQTLTNLTLSLPAALFPPAPAIALRRGELLELLGRLEDANAAFISALSLQGPAINTQLGGVRPRMGLVRIAIALQDMDAARAHLQLAHQLAPNDREVVFTKGLL
jgi:tetratricopeptide (TPR) repeat protein